MMKILSKLYAFSALFLAFTAQGTPEKYPYRAVTTVGMITDIVRNVAGDKAQVEGLIGEGIDPHLYKPTRNDLIALKHADIIFYNGLMLEGKMADVLTKLARRGQPVYAVTEDIQEPDAVEIANLESKLKWNEQLAQNLYEKIKEVRSSLPPGQDAEDSLKHLKAQAEEIEKIVETQRSQLERAKNYVLSDESSHYDPHVWMDVQGWIRATQAVAKSLSEYDPQNATYYEKNAKAYIAKLRQLDSYARKAIATIPENQRILVTAHDAFNYMGRAYGLQVKGIQGLSTESEAGVRDIENLVDFLVKNKIPAVFVETSVSDKNVRALIEGASSRGHNLVIGGSLYSDAMGATGTYEGTYIGMIDHNVTTITIALGGQAPKKGLNDKLAAAH